MNNNIDVEEASAIAYELANDYARAVMSMGFVPIPDGDFKVQSVAQQFLGFLLEDNSLSFATKKAALSTEVKHKVHLIERYEQRLDIYHQKKVLRHAVSEIASQLGKQSVGPNRKQIIRGLVDRFGDIPAASEIPQVTSDMIAKIGPLPDTSVEDVLFQANRRVKDIESLDPSMEQAQPSRRGPQ